MYNALSNPRQARTLGAVAPAAPQAGLIFGMTPQTFQTVAILAGGVVLGVFVMRTLQGIGKGISAKRAKAKRNFKRVSGSLAGKQNPVWQTLLLAGVTGGAAYYLARRSA